MPEFDNTYQRQTFYRIKFKSWLINSWFGGFTSVDGFSRSETFLTT